MNSSSRASTVGFLAGVLRVVWECVTAHPRFSLFLSRSIWHLFLPPRGGQSHKLIGWWGDVPKLACIGQSVYLQKVGVRGALGVRSQAGNRWAGLGERALWWFTLTISPTPPYPIPPHLTVWREEMGLWIWGRVLEAGLRRWR